MLKGKRFPVLLLLIIAGFFYGVTKLLILRFQRGDAYPPYSSLRSDPLGTKAFFEGLRLLQGVETARNVEALQKASGLRDSTLFLFGLQEARFSAIEQESAKALDEAALAGGRVVISFVPTHALSVKRPKEKEECPTPQENEKEENDEEQKLLEKELIDLYKRWGVEMEYFEEKASEARRNAPDNALPSSLAWHGTLLFEPQDDAWQTIYATAGKPVLIQRSYGKGSIILSADSFFLSNEAMKTQRYANLLSWLCGTHRRIIFDETHLGVRKAPGIVTLLRKYGFAPFLISLLGLAILAIWKYSAKFIPADEEGEQAVVDPGKDASAGLTNLLRRNISSKDILPACLEEWKRSFTHGNQNFSALLPRIQKLIAEDRGQSRRNRHPLQAYRQISTLQRRQ